MPASNASWPTPLTRAWPVYPGQWGIRGSDNTLGLRMHSTGAVFYVDQNHPDRNDNNDGTDPDHPLATVAAAEALCRPMRGDAIAVMQNNAWLYANPADGFVNPVHENLVINTPGIRLVGVSQSSSTGVYWTPASNAGTCITVNAADVLIEGFIFGEGAHTGCTAIASFYDGAATFGDNLTVRNCTFSPTVDDAINLTYVWYANIHHCDFFECDAKGIETLGGSGSAFLVISDNRFIDCATTAMDLTNTDHSFVFNNMIYNASNQGGASGTNTGIVTTTGGQNSIYGNYFSCLLPCASAGDFNDMNTAAADDAWIANFCLNGMTTGNPT